MDTEDGLVHCIKPGGMAAISAETAMLLAGNEDNLDGSDSFASDEDLEDDKTVIDNKLCVSNSICHLLNH